MVEYQSLEQSLLILGREKEPSNMQLKDDVTPEVQDNVVLLKKADGTVHTMLRHVFEDLFDHEKVKTVDEAEVPADAKEDKPADSPAPQEAPSHDNQPQQTSDNPPPNPTAPPVV